MTAANEAPELLLQHHLRKLRLPSVLRAYEKLARQCAAEHADHVRYLARLIELALIDREARMVERRIKAARFPSMALKLLCIVKSCLRHRVISFFERPSAWRRST